MTIEELQRRADAISTLCAEEKMPGSDVLMLAADLACRAFANFPPAEHQLIRSWFIERLDGGLKLLEEGNNGRGQEPDAGAAGRSA